jgi:hypothetical protein
MEEAFQAMKQYPESSNPSTARRTATLIAVSFVAAEIINTAVLALFIGPQPTRVVVAWMIRILLASCLAYFVVRGAQWARWVMAALAIITVGRSIVVLIGPSYPPQAPRLFFPWGVSMVLYYSAVACLLIFSKNVAAHFVSHRTPSTA